MRLLRRSSTVASALALVSVSAAGLGSSTVAAPHRIAYRRRPRLNIDQRADSMDVMSIAQHSLARLHRRLGGSIARSRRRLRSAGPSHTDRTYDRPMALYDAIASIYDPWSASVTEDIEFYVDEALASGGPVVELAVGTGRVAVPIAFAGVPVIGIDQSEHMLAVARERAQAAGVETLVDLRLGDLRDPPTDVRVPLVICPFRSLLHMPDDDEKLRALAAARAMLEPGGKLIFDVFCPSSADIEETHGRWLEREPGILERADWDETTRTLSLSVRGAESEATMSLHWATPAEWQGLLDRAGFELEALYGWFDRRAFDGDEDSVWIARSRPAR